MTTLTQKLKILLLYFVIFTLLAACGPLTTTVDGKQCIMPKLSAIPKEIPLYWDTNGGRNPRKVPSRDSIPSWMVPQFSLLQQKSIPPADYSIDMAVDKNIFWIAYFDFIIQYNRSASQIKVYNFGKLDSVVRIDDILVTSNHNIWVAGTHLSKDTQYSVLLHYSIKSDSFEVVEDVGGLLHPNDSSIEKTIGWGKDRILKESPGGIILYTLRGKIYSYNPTTNKAKEIFANSEMNVASIESDPRGYIWFTVTGNDRLWLLHPDSNQLRSFELPNLYLGTDKLNGMYFRDGYTLYLDSHERVWLPSWSFLDTSKKEYKWQVLPAMPLFINLYDLDYVYTWDKVNVFETKDGSIWFTSMNGVIYYDMGTGSTCWISPESGLVAETPDSVLWILLKKQLYQYKP